MKGVKYAHPNYVHIWSLEILLHWLLAALTANPGEPGAGRASVSLGRGAVGCGPSLNFKAFWRIITQTRINSPISKVMGFCPIYLKKNTIPLPMWLSTTYAQLTEKNSEPKPLIVSSHTLSLNGKSDHFWCVTSLRWNALSRLNSSLETRVSRTMKCTVPSWDDSS